MKKLVSLTILCFSLFAPATSLLAQAGTADAQMIELTPDELKIMIRKMAELRRQRVLMWQRQQMVQRRAASLREKAENATPGTRTIVREEVNVRVDTLMIKGEDSRPEYGIARTSIDVPPADTNARMLTSVDNSAELSDLRQRMLRQEDILQRLLDRSPAPLTSPAPAAAPEKSAGRTDTILQQIMLSQSENRGASLSKKDLDALTGEMSRMNVELSTLRRRLADEEDRRRRAEDEAYRASSRDDRAESWESERLRYERDLNRTRREEERNRTVSPVTPVVIEKEAPVRIIRDTVYVDRVSTTPVFIPTTPKTDTVTIIKEAEPTVIKDTVMVEREREIVKTDTVQLKATEPISFPTIFFDNNSSQLNTAHRNLLATVVTQLQGKTGYTVRLTGFASKSGNAAYNQQLSAKRAGAVRKGLEDLGMRNDQITIVPGGIDYQPANAAAARRVEVQALPR